LNKIQIHSRNIYILKAVKAIIDYAFSVNTFCSEKVIFVFDGPCISYSEIVELRQCASTNILIIGRRKIIQLIENALHSTRYQYCSLDNDILSIFSEIKTFINTNTSILIGETIQKPVNKLTARESNMLNLFTSGVSVTTISKSMSIPLKKVYAIKRVAYKKIGISSDAQLINHKEIIIKIIMQGAKTL